MIVRLEERVRDLETRVGQDSGNSSRPPSSDLPGTPKRPTSRPRGQVANPITSPTSGPLRHADGRGDLLDARPGPVRLLGWSVHREHGRPRRPPALPSVTVHGGRVPGRFRCTLW